MSTGAGAPCEGIVSTVLVHRQAPQEGFRDREYRGTTGGHRECRGTTGGQSEYRGTTTSLVSLTILCIPLSIIKLLVFHPVAN